VAAISIAASIPRFAPRIVLVFRQYPNGSPAGRLAADG
jgi:hypothetical protein